RKESGLAATRSLHQESSSARPPPEESTREGCTTSAGRRRRRSGADPRRYRTVWGARARGVVPMDMWCAGIDWADQHHDVVVLDAAGARVGQVRVPHSAAGVEVLIAWLRQIGDIARCPEHLACLIETSQGVLITALLEHGLSVYPVNPKTVDRARKPSGAK